MIVNIAQHAAVVDKVPVAIFSLEMSKEELVDRLLVGQADVDAWRIKTGKLSDYLYYSTKPKNQSAAAVH